MVFPSLGEAEIVAILLQTQSIEVAQPASGCRPINVLRQQ